MSRKKDFGRGPLNDAHELMRMGGRLFPPSPSLIDPALAPKIPSLKAKALDSSQFDLQQACAKHHATLLHVSLSEYGNQITSQWKLSYLKEFVTSAFFEEETEMGFLDLRPIASWSKWVLWSALVKFMQRRDTHQRLHGRTVVYRGGGELAQALGFENMMGGYVFLVDGMGRVRWKAAGAPQGETEIRQMLDLAWILREEGLQQSANKRK